MAVCATEQACVRDRVSFDLGQQLSPEAVELGPLLDVEAGVVQDVSTSSR